MDVAGRVDVSGPAPAQSGGTVEMLGESVTLADGARGWVLEHHAGFEVFKKIPASDLVHEREHTRGDAAS